MLWAGHTGGLEIRRSGEGETLLSGTFPYGEAALLSDGGATGRPRKEIIAPRAFSYRVGDPNEDIHFLVGHSYDRPLASKKAGTLSLKDGDDALRFEAKISGEMREVSYVKDFLAAMSAGLILGLSPGFRIPPKRAVEDAETVEDEGHDPENGAHNAIIRTVHQALLYELSAVTRPAYDKAQIEARNWTGGNVGMLVKKSHIQRWRA
ncbi:hypothetical protein JT55_10475 [Rhodovulum sp. NI22]|nr:hypothetical protein JT55_10475 [Rhodovulum sp. NI22]